MMFASSVLLAITQLLVVALVQLQLFAQLAVSVTQVESVSLVQCLVIRQIMLKPHVTNAR